MNRHTFARFVRLAVMLCVLLSCLALLQAPAFAIAIVNDFAQESISIPGPLPFGTSFSFLPGFTLNSQSFSGNAIATGAALLSSPPGTVTAIASGFASGPGPSSSFVNTAAVGQMSIFNGNPTTVTFPFTVSFTRSESASTSGDPSESVSSFAAYGVTFDSGLFLTSAFSLCLSPCNSFDSGSDSFLIGLTPGTHTLRFSVSAESKASFLDPTPEPAPEPASLLLLGTTMAGLRLGARWRRRRQD